MVPFSLRVLQAELPGYLGNVAMSIDLLYTLLHYCRTEREALRLQQSAPHHSTPLLTNATSPSPPLISLSPQPTASPNNFTETLLLSALPSASDTQLAPAPTIDALAPLRDQNTITDDSWSAREVRVVCAICSRLLQQRDFIQALQLINELLLHRANDAALWSVLGRIHLQVRSPYVHTYPQILS